MDAPEGLAKAREGGLDGRRIGDVDRQRQCLPAALLHQSADGGRFLGRVWGMRVLLLTTTGRKSGQPRSTPLSCLEHEGGYVVVASNGGARNDPAWYRNLQHDPRARIQVGRQQMAVRAEVLGPAERAALWERLVAVAPTYGRYAGKTEREIPLVWLRPDGR